MLMHVRIFIYCCLKNNVDMYFARHRRVVQRTVEWFEAHLLLCVLLLIKMGFSEY